MSIRLKKILWASTPLVPVGIFFIWKSSQYDLYGNVLFGLMGLACFALFLIILIVVATIDFFRKPRDD